MRVDIYTSVRSVGQTIELDEAELDAYIESDEFKEIWTELGNENMDVVPVRGQETTGAFIMLMPRPR